MTRYVFSDNHDRVIPLDDCPPCAIGAPLPTEVAREHHAVLAYVAAQAPPPGWHGQSITLVNEKTPREAIVIVDFLTCAEVLFGWFPSENTIANHPLASRGLVPYGVYRVASSSWKRQLMCLEPRSIGGREEAFARMEHYIFTFHDSTFECISDTYHVRTVKGPMADVIQEMVVLLKEA